MRSFLLILMLPMLFAGCLKHQYVTLSSNLAKDSSLRNFVAEDSDLYIEYNFNDKYCPVNIFLFNKSDSPLYVSWKESGIVMGGELFSFWNELSPEDVSRIPPKGKKYVNFVTMQREFFKMPKTRVRFNITTEAGPVTALKQAYTRNNSPLFYGSYLVCSKSASFETKKIYDADFWVEEVVQTSVKPEHYEASAKPQSRFYNTEATTFGVITALFAMIGIVAVKVILE